LQVNFTVQNNYNILYLERGGSLLCLVCGLELGLYDFESRQKHMNFCLDKYTIEEPYQDNPCLMKAFASKSLSSKTKTVMSLISDIKSYKILPISCSDALQENVETLRNYNSVRKEKNYLTSCAFCQTKLPDCPTQQALHFELCYFNNSTFVQTFGNLNGRELKEFIEEKKATKISPLEGDFTVNYLDTVENSLKESNIVSHICRIGSKTHVDKKLNNPISKVKLSDYFELVIKESCKVIQGSYNRSIVDNCGKSILTSYHSADHR
jgi:hypothetical protein